VPSLQLALPVRAAHPTVVGVAGPPTGPAGPGRTSATIPGMSRETSGRVLVALSVCYGILLGILAALDVGALGTVAVIGALVLGALWVLRGLFSGRSRAT
jgi:hypothetical protein